MLSQRTSIVASLIVLTAWSGCRTRNATSSAKSGEVLPGYFGLGRGIKYIPGVDTNNECVVGIVKEFPVHPEESDNSGSAQPPPEAPAERAATNGGNLALADSLGSDAFAHTTFVDEASAPSSPEALIAGALESSQSVLQTGSSETIDAQAGHHKGLALSDEGTTSPTRCVSYGAGTWCAAILFAKTQQDVQNALSLEGEAKFRYGIVNSGIKSNVARNTSSNNKSSYLIVKATYEASARYLKNPKLSPRSGTVVGQAFYDVCGDRYVSKLITGGLFYGVIKMKDTASTAHTNVGVSGDGHDLTGQGGSGSLSVDSLGSLKGQIEDITVFQAGGGIPQPIVPQIIPPGTTPTATPAPPIDTCPPPPPSQGSRTSIEQMIAAFRCFPIAVQQPNGRIALKAILSDYRGVTVDDRPNPNSSQLWTNNDTVNDLDTISTQAIEARGMLSQLDSYPPAQRDKLDGLYTKIRAYANARSAMLLKCQQETTTCTPAATSALANVDVSTLGDVPEREQAIKMDTAYLTTWYWFFGTSWRYNTLGYADAAFRCSKNGTRLPTIDELTQLLGQDPSLLAPINTATRPASYNSGYTPNNPGCIWTSTPSPTDIRKQQIFCAPSCATCKGPRATVMENDKYQLYNVMCVKPKS
jgi:hypothetical protein